MKAIYLKELKGYFHSFLGYLFCAFILLMIGVFTMAMCLQGGYPNFEYVLNNMMVILLIAVPLLSMRIFAQERKEKTEILLYSLPVSMTRIVLGKYFAMLTVMAIPTVIMSFYPLVLSAYGNVNLLSAYGAILGFYLLCAALAAVGMFISSVCENQIIAAVITILALLLNYFLESLSAYVGSSALGALLCFTVIIAALSFFVYAYTKNSFVALICAFVLEATVLLLYIIMPDTVSTLIPGILSSLSLFTVYYDFVRGIFDLAAIAYLLGAAVIFTFITVQSLEKRRWS